MILKKRKEDAIKIIDYIVLSYVFSNISVPGEKLPKSLVTYKAR